MVTITLHGQLSKFRGNQEDGSWLLNVETPHEAVMAIDANCPGIAQYLVDSAARNIEYRVLIDGQDIEHVDQVNVAMGEYDTIDIIPVMVGEASQGWWQIIAGVVLVIVGVVIGIATSWTGVGAIVGGIVWKFGVSLILSGIVSLVFAPGATDNGSKGKNKPSYLFGGQVNGTRQGEGVPICYGRLIVGSQLISAYLTTFELDKNGHLISQIGADPFVPSSGSTTGPLAPTGGLQDSGRAPADDGGSNDEDFDPVPTVLRPGQRNRV